MCTLHRIISTSVLAIVALSSFVVAYPKIRVERQAPGPEEALGLPSNATSIRSEITDSFSCESRIYGYYADVDNECQLFHVCLPVQFADGKEKIFKWSFICPEETVFNQESFTCTRPEDAVACEESPQYYSLNEEFGRTDRPIEPSPSPADGETTLQ
ncbi:U-scoloptoxin(01)-Cw1a-like [Cryptotermes secundus]|uniref:U-scoloptoxin(01)-Cw1a-like n=1 Tax=Cryptotermes secundus TaxID=105785 RepID=UPI001454D3A9|nr:U-scoloptoxin(01)-Cw1a-like [Cryptotermes secundus]